MRLGSEHQRKLCKFPLDGHIEAVFGDPNLDNLADINAIVEEFGGDCDECSPISSTCSPAWQGSSPDQRST
jgi:hypothetical protein